jgi:hypothetical protein
MQNEPFLMLPRYDGSMPFLYLLLEGVSISFEVCILSNIVRRLINQGVVTDFTCNNIYIEERLL